MFVSFRRDSSLCIFKRLSETKFLCSVYFLFRVGGFTKQAKCWVTDEKSKVESLAQVVDLASFFSIIMVVIFSYQINQSKQQCFQVLMLHLNQLKTKKENNSIRWVSSIQRTSSLYKAGGNPFLKEERNETFCFCFPWSLWFASTAILRKHLKEMFGISFSLRVAMEESPFCRPVQDFRFGRV